MQVRWFNFERERREIGASLEQAYERVLSRGLFIRGPELKAFEQEFASYCGARFAVGVGNGLDAIRLGLKALEVGNGDEVIVPAFTFIATWLAVTDAGATPVPVDVRPDTANLDVSKLSEAITPRTKAIVPVDLYGRPADLDPILELAHRHGLRVVQDSAQSHGATYRGKRVGSLADLTTFSFYPVKNLGALGDGGGVTTDDPELAERIRQLGNYGSADKRVHTSRGYNSRLDELQAAFLRAKLPHLDAWNDRRKRMARTYLRELDGHGLALPPDDPSHSWHIFAIQHAARDRLHDSLGRRGVETLVHYPAPPHLQPAYAYLGFGAGAFPVAESLARTELSLPLSPFHTEDEQAFVIDELAQALALRP